MTRVFWAFISVALLLVIGGTTAGQRQVASASDDAMAGPPTMGYTLHIDADKHFGAAHPDEIAHHWCKSVSPTLIECQLYDGDGPHAHLVGVETVVPAAVWKTFPPAEQAMWHYHKTELQKVHATLPDTPKSKQAGIIAMLKPTYGKVWILWDPLSHQQPTGQPSITILH